MFLSLALCWLRTLILANFAMHQNLLESGWPAKNPFTVHVSQDIAGAGRDFPHSFCWKDMVLRAGMLLMKSCFLRENMRKDLFPKCNKMRKENKATSPQFLFKLLLQQTLWPKASCPSERFHSHPPVAFFFLAFCRVGAFISCIMELNRSFWLVWRKKQPAYPSPLGKGGYLWTVALMGASQQMENKEYYLWNLRWLFVAAITDYKNKGAANAEVKCDSTSHWLHICALSFFFFFLNVLPYARPWVFILTAYIIQQAIKLSNVLCSHSLK